MRWMTSLLLGILGISSPLAYATSSLDVEYHRFYSHLQKLTGEDTQALQFAFGFIHHDTADMCAIDSANIVTDKQTIALDVSAEQRFTLPAEKALQLADASVHIVFTDNDIKPCDMSVQLETRSEYLKSYYSAEELTMLVGQYEAFFNEMGSFLSFMMLTQSLTKYRNKQYTINQRNPLRRRKYYFSQCIHEQT